MSEDNIQTDQTAVTGALRRPPSLLPWILFGVTAGVLAALTIVLVGQVSAERQRASEQAQLHANSSARAERGELALGQLKEKVAPLEEQVQALTVERDELSGRVRALSLEAAKGAPEAAPVVAQAPAKEAVKKAGKKKKPVKKKRRR